MSRRHSAAVAVRRFLVRRPWVYWSIVALAVTGAAATALERTERVDEARRAWGAERTVWVAVTELAPGDDVLVERRVMPAAMVAPGSIDDPRGAIMRQHVAAGEIVHELDVAAPSGPRALTPDDWLIVPIVESPASGASLGDRVQIASDGFVLSSDALVVGHHGDATLVAAPGGVVAAVAAAGSVGGVTLLIVP